MRRGNMIILGLVPLTTLMVCAGWFNTTLAKGASTVSTPNLNGVTSVQVKAFNGQIKITRGKTARVVIAKRGDIEVTQIRQAEIFSIITRQKSQFCTRCEVSVEVQLPAAMRLNLETSNGEIIVLGASLDVRASTSNADITVKNAGKTNLTLETSNGQVEVNNVTGDLRIDTSNADVNLENIEGSLQVDTSAGAVTLKNIRFRKGSKSAINTSENIIQAKRLLVPDGFQIKGSTSNAGIRFKLPNFDVELEDTEFSAIKNGGSGDAGSLSLDTSNGEIQLEP
jgi:DUF4097 and DUF4098 domain-containing protein YvlB